MKDDELFELAEDGVPLDGIRETSEEVIDLLGGTVDSSDESEIRFRLPERRGMTAAGTVACSLAWTNEDGGTIRLRAEKAMAPPKASRLILLATGVVGAFLWLLWPFFPNLGAAAWIGGAVAIATYFVTLRRTPLGTAADLVQRIASRQRDQRP